MGLKIRLRKQGRTNRPFYRLVVAEATAPRDGKYLESLGWYNPVEAAEDKKFALQEERVQHWLNVGAKLTDNVENLIRKCAPHIVRAQLEKECAHRAKIALKRKTKQ